MLMQSVQVGQRVLMVVAQPSIALSQQQVVIQTPEERLERVVVIQGQA